MLIQGPRTVCRGSGTADEPTGDGIGQNVMAEPGRAPALPEVPGRAPRRQAPIQGAVRLAARPGAWRQSHWQSERRDASLGRHDTRRANTPCAMN